jgi:hypothetical protein
MNSAAVHAGDVPMVRYNRVNMRALWPRETSRVIAAVAYALAQRKAKADPPSAFFSASHLPANLTLMCATPRSPFPPSPPAETRHCYLVDGRQCRRLHDHHHHHHRHVLSVGQDDHHHHHILHLRSCFVRAHRPWRRQVEVCIRCCSCGPRARHWSRRGPGRRLRLRRL